MPKSDKELIASDLRRRILTLELQPGAALDEAGLATHYGVSRTPMREVFRDLSGEGYIALKDRRGQHIAPQVSPMDHETMRSFFQTAPLIYATIGRLAARNGSAAQLVELSAVQAKFRDSQSSRDVLGMITGNDRFHAIIGEMADNPYLFPSYKRLLIDHARIGQTFWRQRGGQEVETAADHHDQFIERLSDQDEEGVVALTLAHWELSRLHLERFVRPEPLPINGGAIPIAV